MIGILIGLYSYLMVKTYLVSKERFRALNTTLFEFFEILLFGGVIGFVFDYMYSRKSGNLVISESIVWIAFIAALLMLGVGVGVRFVSEILSRVVTRNEIFVFDKIHLIHDFYSKIWIVINISFLALIFAIIEISSPLKGAGQSELIQVNVLCVFSFLFGGFYAINSRNRPDIRKINSIAFLAISLCLVVLLIENSVYYDFKSFPITNSFLAFAIAYFIGQLYIVLMPSNAPVNIAYTTSAPSTPPEPSKFATTPVTSKTPDSPILSLNVANEPTAKSKNDSKILQNIVKVGQKASPKKVKNKEREVKINLLSLKDLKKGK